MRGDNPQLYRDLERLRPLHKKVHLQEIQGPADTDWNTFNWNEVCCIGRTIQHVFTNPLFRPSREEVAYFAYLDRYTAT